MKHFIHKFLFSGNWGFTLPKCREIGSGQTGDPCQGSVWVRGNKGCGVRAARRPVRLYNPLQHRFGGDITSMLSLCHYVCSIVLITVTLIIRVTLFSRGHHSGNIHGTLFSRFVIYCSIIHSRDIIGEDFIFASPCSHEFTQK